MTVSFSWKPRSKTWKSRLGSNDPRSHTASIIKRSWKWRDTGEGQIDVHWTGSARAELNNDRQSPHKTSRGGFLHWVPLTPHKKISPEHFLPPPTQRWLVHSAGSPCPHAFHKLSRANRYKGQWSSGVEGFWWVTSNAALAFTVTQSGDICHCISLIQRVHIPEVRALIHHYSHSPAVPLISMKQQLFLTHHPQHKCCLGPQEANSALTLPTTLKMCCSS